MKNVILILLFSLMNFLDAQNINVDYIEDIKADTSYYWGEGKVYNSEDKAAKDYDALYSNIIDNCTVSLLYFASDNPLEYLKNILKTFEDDISDIMFQYSMIDNGKEFQYFSYMKRSDFRKICKNRIGEIQKYANSGLKLERKKSPQMYDAMVSYCKGMSLCIAHPMGSSIKVKIDRKEYDAYSWFEEKINQILSSFSFSVSKKDPGEYNNKGIFVNMDVNVSDTIPTEYLKYSYFNGQGNITSSVYKGKTWIQLYDKNMTDFVIRVEYDFLDNVVPKTKNLIESINKDTFKSNVRMEIDLTSYLDEFSEEDEIVLDEEISANDFGNDYQSIIKEVEKGLRSKKYSDIRRFFTRECYDMLDTLCEYGDLSVFGKQQYEFIEHNDIVICRGILMKFEFEKHEFYDEVVFRFDKQTNLISSIAFRLDSQAENNIYSKTIWPLDNRLTLISFLEDYQTAYALKRYDYLESIFSDDALIITGHVLKKVENPMPDRMTFNLPSNQITMIKQDKDSYFKNLANVFNKQEFIHIRFGETDFQRQMSMGDDESYNKKEYKDIYGVRLFQEYKSGTYSDEGYLFLMVDLRKEMPIIHVRAWQPDKIGINDVMSLKNLR